MGALGSPIKWAPLQNPYKTVFDYSRNFDLDTVNIEIKYEFYSLDDVNQKQTIPQQLTPQPQLTSTEIQRIDDLEENMDDLEKDMDDLEEDMDDLEDRVSDLED